MYIPDSPLRTPPDAVEQRLEVHRPLSVRSSHSWRGRRRCAHGSRRLPRRDYAHRLSAAAVGVTFLPKLANDQNHRDAFVDGCDRLSYRVEPTRDALWGCRLVVRRDHRLCPGDVDSHPNFGGMSLWDDHPFSGCSGGDCTHPAWPGSLSARGHFLPTTHPSPPRTLAAA